jgi:molybdenum cofactor cytidylyltransferase
MRTFALLPAGGTSSRMGRPKLALPLGERTVLERVLDAVRSARVASILVVLGPAVADLKDVAERAGARTLVLDRQTADMRATVERGLDWLEQNERPEPGDAFLLLPPDHPTLTPAAIEDLLTARAASTSAATIWLPTYQGQRGHPALIGWNHVAGIRALPQDQGLNRYLREHAADTLLVPSSSPEVLCDLDTPEDYERLKSSWKPEIPGRVAHG